MFVHFVWCWWWIRWINRCISADLVYILKTMTIYPLCKVFLSVVYSMISLKSPVLKLQLVKLMFSNVVHVFPFCDSRIPNPQNTVGWNMIVSTPNTTDINRTWNQPSLHLLCLHNFVGLNLNQVPGPSPRHKSCPIQENQTLPFYNRMICIGCFHQIPSPVVTVLKSGLVFYWPILQWSICNPWFVSRSIL